MLCEGKVAIVTGAAGNGMGRSIALTLSREGASVVVNYRKSSGSAADIVAHIEEQGGRAIAFQADITEQAQCKALVDATVDAFGQVDVCVVGPGGGWHMEPVHALNSVAALDDAQRELAPIYHLMPLVLPDMYARKWGRLIAITLQPPYATPAYAYNVAKGARANALLLARDAAWANGVTVNSVAPGPIAAIEDMEVAFEQCEHGAAWQNRGTTSPQDVAETVTFLCSEAGRFISGAVIPFMHR